MSEETVQLESEAFEEPSRDYANCVCDDGFGRPGIVTGRGDGETGEWIGIDLRTGERWATKELNPEVLYENLHAMMYQLCNVAYRNGQEAFMESAVEYLWTGGYSQPMDIPDELRPGAAIQPELDPNRILQSVTDALRELPIENMPDKYAGISGKGS